MLERLKHIPADDAATLWAGWSRCAEVPAHQGQAVWLHGDLHPLNVLADFDAPAALRAVIDWGDLCRGDPATDLAIAWLAFDAAGRAAFRHAAAGRHRLGDPVRDRALAWAISLGLVFMRDAEPGTVARGVGEHLLVQVERELAG